ncbi:MAG: lipocalin-like domain-containing protein [Acetobacteraceae bacterium]|nr:lipocalin-like domain-containing protein [Acetobacteraceae bacterium]
MTRDEIERRILGTWRLVETFREELATGRRVAQFGAAPEGRIAYTPEHRMMALVTAGGSGGARSPSEAERARLHGSMVAYAGRWEALDGAVRHHVEVSWQPATVGDVFLRHARFEGTDRLVLTSSPGPSAMDGVESVVTIVWERAPPG